MPAQVSESLVLRSYPFREGDLIVSFFARDRGKLRGAARRARRPKSPFGSGLERMSRVRMAYFEREGADLVTLTGCELIQSPLGGNADYGRSLALDFVTEVAEHMLPPHEPNEKFFRLLASAVDYLGPQGGEVWAAVLYVSLWSVRLTGILPELRVSNASGEIAGEMFAKPLTGLDPREWSKSTGQDLRRALVRAMEQHAERRFLTVPLLESL